MQPSSSVPPRRPMDMSPPRAQQTSQQSGFAQRPPAVVHPYGEYGGPHASMNEDYFGVTTAGTPSGFSPSRTAVSPDTTDSGNVSLRVHSGTVASDHMPYTVHASVDREPINPFDYNTTVAQKSSQERTASFTHSSGGSGSTMPSRQPIRASGRWPLWIGVIVVVAAIAGGVWWAVRIGALANVLQVVTKSSEQQTTAAKPSFDGKTAPQTPAAAVVETTDTPPSQDVPKTPASTVPFVGATYTNTAYGYSFRHPEGTFVFATGAEAPLEQTTLNDGALAVARGGRIFVTTAKDLSTVDPQNPPVGFWVLTMTVYEKNNLSLQNLAQSFGYDGIQGQDYDVVDFSAIGVVGREYVMSGEGRNDPRVAVIFQKGQRFYVFMMDGLEGRVEMAQKLEEIVHTFSIQP